MGLRECFVTLLWIIQMPVNRRLLVKGDTVKDVVKLRLNFKQKPEVAWEKLCFTEYIVLFNSFQNYQECIEITYEDSYETFSINVTHFSDEKAATAAVEVRDYRFTLFVPLRTKSWPEPWTSHWQLHPQHFSASISTHKHTQKHAYKQLHSPNAQVYILQNYRGAHSM